MWVTLIFFHHSDILSSSVTVHSWLYGTEQILITIESLDIVSNVLFLLNLLLWSPEETNYKINKTKEDFSPETRPWPIGKKKKVVEE